MSKSEFTCRINSKVVIHLEVEGDDDLVADFKKTLTGTFGAFSDVKKELGQIFINGIRHEIQIVKRDEKGHFVKKEKGMS